MRLGRHACGVDGEMSAPDRRRFRLRPVGVGVQRSYLDLAGLPSPDGKATGNDTGQAKGTVTTQVDSGRYEPLRISDRGFNMEVLR